MAILTQGQTATLAMVKADSVTIESGQSMVSIEYPVGTKIFEGRGARTFGPFTGGSLKITATAGTCEYEYADGSDPVAAITGTPSDQAAFQALVSGGGKLSGVVEALLIGDSMTAGNADNTSVATCSRSGGVATVTFGGNHGTGSMETVRFYNCSDESFNLDRAVVTKVDNLTLTYPCPGPDLSAAARNLSGTKAMQYQRNNTQSDGGYLFWLNSKSKGAFRRTLNAGCNGQTAADMLANLPKYLLTAPEAQAAIILTGYNDFAAEGRTAEAVFDDVNAMLDLLGNRLIVVVSAVPWTTGGTTANRYAAIKYNSLIRAEVNKRPNARYADAAKMMIDNASATVFAPLAGMLRNDNVHPSPKGQEKIAAAIWDVIKNDVSTPSRLVASKYDNFGSNTASTNIFDAGPWTNTGGNVSGGATGTVGAGLYAVNVGGGATVASCPARADGLGWNQQIVHTPSAANGVGTISSGGYVYDRVVGGQVIVPMFEVTLSGLPGSAFKGIEVIIGFDASLTAATALKCTAESAAQYPQVDGTFVFVGPEITVPGGATDYSLSINALATGAGSAVTVQVGLISVERFA